jgi:glucokinase-like ROK family protein
MQLPTKATHQQTRAFNLGLVLRTLYDLGPVSRADVARLTGLTRTTVGELVSDLLVDGLVREVGRGVSTGGKTPILLEVVDDARQVIGLDLGERRFLGALVNLRGDVDHVSEVPVDGRDGEAALDALRRLIDELIATSERTATASAPLLGIGLGTPGVVDTRTGTILWAVNLDWQDLPLGALLHQRYGLPVYIANDSRAAALGEYLFRREGRVENLIAIKVGPGIGAGIVLGGELFQGDGHGAGEIGHIAVVDDGAQCRCGRFGCLETVASSRAIVDEATRRATGAGSAGRLGATLRANGELTFDDVHAALQAGDEQAREVVVAAGRALGRAIAGLIGTLNINRIVLLGSVAELGDVWLDAVRDEAARRSLGMLVEDTRIERGRATDDVVLLGASALLMTRELDLVPRR